MTKAECRKLNRKEWRMGRAAAKEFNARIWDMIKEMMPYPDAGAEVTRDATQAGQSGGKDGVNL